MSNIKNIIKGPIDFTQIPDIPKNPNIPDIDLSEEVSNIYLNYQGLKEYHSKTNITLEDIVDFHVRFERIHPFADGNGRVGRIIMFKECLKNNIMLVLLISIMNTYNKS